MVPPARTSYRTALVFLQSQRLDWNCSRCSECLSNRVPAHAPKAVRLVSTNSDGTRPHLPGRPFGLPELECLRRIKSRQKTPAMQAIASTRIQPTIEGRVLISPPNFFVLASQSSRPPAYPTPIRAAFLALALHCIAQHSSLDLLTESQFAVWRARYHGNCWLARAFLALRDGAGQIRI